MGLAEEGSERARSAEDQANERPQTLTDGRTDGRAGGAGGHAVPTMPCQKGWHNERCSRSCVIHEAHQ